MQRWSHGRVVSVPAAGAVAGGRHRGRGPSHAEASGFDGIAFIDHLEAPGQPDENIWEAMGIATWVAAKTERLRIGHLVLCDAFRHPAVLAKQAVTLSDASGRQIRARSRCGILARRVHQIRCRSAGSGGPRRATRAPPRADQAVLGTARRRSGPVQHPRPAAIRYRWSWVAAVRRMMELVRQVRRLVEPAGEPPRPAAPPGRRRGSRPDIGPADGGLRPVGQRSGRRSRGEHPAIRSTWGRDWSAATPTS